MNCSQHARVFGVHLGRKPATMARTFPTLRAYFDEAYRPHFLADAAEANLDVYSTTLAKWELLVPPLPLDEITNQWVGVFRAKLIERSLSLGLSAHTTNKYLRTLNAMLAKAGQPGPRNRDALSLIDGSPWAKLVKTHTTRPRAIPLGRLGLIYRACDVARVPKADGIDPAEWWRGLVVCASQIGLRRQALVNGITFAMFDDREQQATAVLRLPAALDKCGVERRKPVNTIAIVHLRRLLERRIAALAPAQLIDAGPLSVFPWAYKSRRGFDITWHAIQDAAGIPRDEHYKFHDLKKTCGTQLATVAGSFAVKSFLDHASIATSEHYCDGGEQLREAVERMPHPVEFDSLPES